MVFWTAAKYSSGLDGNVTHLTFKNDSLQPGTIGHVIR